MIKLVGIEKLDDGNYSVRIDNHGAIKSYMFEISRPKIGGVEIPCLSAEREAELDFWDYNLKATPGRPAGIAVNPIINRIYRIIGNAERDIPLDLPIVLHPAPEGE